MIIRNEPGARWLPVRVDDFDKWQAGLLEESARRLGGVLEPVGRVHRPYSVGSPIVFHGERAWLRVSTFLEHEMKWSAWRGTADAAVIPGVSKPALLHRIEWHVSAPVRVPVSAEVLTLVTHPPASRERFLLAAPDLPDDWFRDLAASLAALRAHPTDRRFPVHDAEKYSYLLGATYGMSAPAGIAPVFGTEHTDLTWANITASRFCILDMEHWGVAVAGYGAAYLYLTALMVPAVAARLHEALADLLRHRVVKAPQSRLDMRDRHVQLGRRESGPERGVHVPVHDQQGGTAGHQLPLHAGDDRRRLLPMRAGADVQVHVRLRQAQVREEHI